MEKKLRVLLSIISILIYSCATSSKEGYEESNKRINRISRLYVQEDYEFKDVEVVQTSKDGDMLTGLGKFDLSYESGYNSRIMVNPEITYQTIEGIGGSFTEASAYVLNQISPEKRQEVIDAYFSQDGAAYSLTRTHIGSCDFSLNSYSYNPEEDITLTSFSIDEDREDLIPLIKDSKRSPGADFKIMASAWTAPPWMKEGGVNSGWYGGKLKEEHHQTFSNYLSKYIQEYAKEGIDIWGITPVNEPLGNANHFESMHFTPLEMNNFIKNNLGPQLRKDGLDTNILIYDQNMDHAVEWIDTILGDKKTSDFIWGSAVHWYASTFEVFPEELNYIHDTYPDKKIIHSEGCIDVIGDDEENEPKGIWWQNSEWFWERNATDWGYKWSSGNQKAMHRKYEPVYRYARNLIDGFNNWYSGWIDWNIVLDKNGGPNHVNNNCAAPVMIDVETEEIFYTPLYYTIAHFSKYIRPGAVRVASGIDSYTNLITTSVKNPDGSIVVVVLNSTGDKIDYQLSVGVQKAQLSIPGEAIQTLILRK